jgi:hypothetical protein
VAEVPSGAGQCRPPDFVCGPLDYDDKNFTKHLVTFETGWTW